ncbi:GNAT family N-acetyltransferase [Saccharophagus degradans]|uniref:GNAT family N-acetyltransferase n=1 Tax=Saccharophagus degradans TaxID=86304 RepID=UPI0013052EA2|nr:GNAT family N-acetyltransferase [Saccharophagus degradans]
MALEFFGENALFEHISSDRLDIRRIDIYDSKVIDGVLELLSVNVTMHLPYDWQDIDDIYKAKSWLEKRLVEGDVFSIYLTHSGELIGLLFLYKFENKSEECQVRVGYLISENYWGKGVGSELICSLLYELSKIHGVVSVVGGVSPDNIGSIKVLTKNGFQLMERVNDTEFYQYKF